MESAIMFLALFFLNPLKSEQNICIWTEPIKTYRQKQALELRQITCCCQADCFSALAE